jgi:hypothetical protein
MQVVKNVVNCIKKVNNMTDEQKYEISNVADDMELNGQERDMFIKEAFDKLMGLSEWEEFYNNLDKIANKYI